MRKVTKGQKKIKCGDVKSRCSKAISQTKEQNLTGPKADIQQSADGNNNLGDNKRKNEVEWDDTAANRAAITAQITREHKPTRRGKLTVKQRSTIITNQSWSGLAESIFGNTLHITITTGIGKITSIFKETNETITITTSYKYFDNTTEPYIEDEEYDKIRNTLGISKYTKYRYYKEAIERNIDVLGKGCYLTEANRANNNIELNKLLEEVIHETISEMDYIQARYIQDIKHTNIDHIEWSANDIKNNYDRMMELTSDQHKKKTYQSLLTEFSKLHDSMMNRRKNNTHNNIDLQTLISQSNTLYNNYHRIIELNRDKERQAIIMSLSVEFDNIYDSLLLMINKIDKWINDEKGVGSWN